MNKSEIYGMPYKRREPKKQAWATGETVKVGFLSLRIVGKVNGDWELINKDATKRYLFTPHHGLQAINY